MHIRRPILLAAAALAISASPTLAESDYQLPDLDSGSAYGDGWSEGASGEWVEAYTGPPVYVDQGAPVPGPQPYNGQPVYAHPAYGPMVPPPGAATYPMGPGMGGQAMGLPPQPGAQRLGYSDEERDDWLRQCRKRYGDQDGGLGGAVIGGVIGGIAGNRIAGSGNRAVGTIAGAAVGAVAGAAIDQAEDSGRARDVCEDYLAQYEASYTGAGAGIATGYGNGYPNNYGPNNYGIVYGQGVVWVPTIVGWNCKPHETVIEERPASRAIPKKTVRIKTKTVPVKTKTIKTTKSIKSTKGS